MNPRISSQFDGGAIIVVDTGRVDDIRVALRSDSHADIRQWFYFRLQGAVGQAARIRITNAGQATYPDGWAGLFRRRLLRPGLMVPRPHAVRRNRIGD